MQVDLEKEVSKAGNIIAVVSGRSGTGKTWFSVTLAHVFSSLKKKILFFDGDLGGANIDAQLGLSIKVDFDSVMRGDTTLNQVINHCDKTKFDFISTTSGKASMSSVPVGKQQIVAEDLCILSSSYDFVIVDTSKDIRQNGHIFAGIASKVIVICTNNRESLTDAYAFIKFINMKYPNVCVMVVVNQVNSFTEGNRAYDTLLSACRNFLGVEPLLLGIVRRDTRVRDAIRNQSPMISRYPTSEAAEDIVIIAKKIIDEDL